MSKVELYNDHFENAKRYNIQHAQLIIADLPYNLGNNAYATFPLKPIKYHFSIISKLR